MKWVNDMDALEVCINRAILAVVMSGTTVISVSATMVSAQLTTGSLQEQKLSRKELNALGAGAKTPADHLRLAAVRSFVWDLVPDSFCFYGVARCSFNRRSNCAFAATMMVERLIATAPTLMGRSSPDRTRRPPATGMATTL